MRKLSLACLLVGVLFSFACSSRTYRVSDEDYYKDKVTLDTKTMQIVESFDDTSLVFPAGERFKKNCDSAEVRASERFVKEFHKMKAEGKLLSSRFDKDGGCTVRMAFQIS